MTNAEKALEFVRPDAVVGLGSGRAAMEFVRALGRKVAAGFNVRGVPTSIATADLARQVGVPLTTLEEVVVLDVAIDGADEVDPQLNLIKGLGGALLREKIVAASARQFVILVGSEKLVPQLGTRGVLPVEVVPFALPLCRRRLSDLGYPAVPRVKGKGLFLTDNGNHVLDCQITALANPASCDREIRAIPGIVETGLFLNMADVVLVQNGDLVDTRRK
jgi:ribose 5-phosphate isomerase A